MPRKTGALRASARPQFAAQVRESERQRRRARRSRTQTVGFRKGEKHTTRHAVGF